LFAIPDNHYLIQHLLVWGKRNINLRAVRAPLSGSRPLRQAQGRASLKKGGDPLRNSLAPLLSSAKSPSAGYPKREAVLAYGGHGFLTMASAIACGGDGEQFFEEGNIVESFEQIGFLCMSERWKWEAARSEV
jgi:hypothetical protein